MNKRWTPSPHIPWEISACRDASNETRQAGPVGWQSHKGPRGFGPTDGVGELVLLEEEAQVLYGALGVFAELRDIAAERLRPSVQQAIKGIKQNALPDRQDFEESLPR